MNDDEWQLRVTAGSTLATSVPSAGVGGSACVRTTIKHGGFLSFHARQPGMFQHASAVDLWMRRVVPAAEAPVNVRFQLLQVEAPAPVPSSLSWLLLSHPSLSDVYIRTTRAAALCEGERDGDGVRKCAVRAVGRCAVQGERDGRLAARVDSTVGVP